MNKTFSIITGIMLISMVSLAQDKDSARVEKGNSEIRQSDQTDSQRPTAEEAGKGQNQDSQNNNQNDQKKSGSSSSTNDASPIPRGEPAILDGTNAIPVDTAKKPADHLRDEPNRPKKKDN